MTELLHHAIDPSCARVCSRPLKGSAHITSKRAAFKIQPFSAGWQTRALAFKGGRVKGPPPRSAAIRRARRGKFRARDVEIIHERARNVPKDVLRGSRVKLAVLAPDLTAPRGVKGRSRAI